MWRHRLPNVTSHSGTVAAAGPPIDVRTHSASRGQAPGYSYPNAPCRPTEHRPALAYRSARGAAHRRSHRYFANATIAGTGPPGHPSRGSTHADPRGSAHSHASPDAHSDTSPDAHSDTYPDVHSDTSPGAHSDAYPDTHANTIARPYTDFCTHFSPSNQVNRRVNQL